MFRSKSVIFLCSLFGLLFCAISLVNHYNFRTYAWDLGITNNAIYDYAHLRWNDCMLLPPQYVNILGDHFSLIPVLVSPFYWITGTYTMLIFQIVSILFGGCGIYYYFQHRFANQTLSALAMLHFFLVWGIYAALAFDYHDNVVGAMFVPWFILFFEKGDWKKATSFFILICISKENMALWAVFISLGLLILHHRDRVKLKAALLYIVIALTYFIVILTWVIPALSNTGSYHHFNFNAIGPDFIAAIKTIISSPKYTFQLLFENHINDSSLNGIKSELHFMVLLSGGFVLLLKPQYLIMLLPIYAAKLFNDDVTKWGLSSQYSIEFAPILSIALFNSIGELKSGKKIMVAIICCMLTSGATISYLDKRPSRWYDPGRHRFYSKSHYLPDYETEKIQEALKLVPPHASVSASSALVPHLAFRDYIYQYPDGDDADFIVLLNGENFYPLSRPDFLSRVDTLNNSPRHQLIYNQDRLIIFKRK